MPLKSRVVNKDESRLTKAVADALGAQRVATLTELASRVTALRRMSEAWEPVKCY